MTKEQLSKLTALRDRLAPWDPLDWAVKILDEVIAEGPMVNVIVEGRSSRDMEFPYITPVPASKALETAKEMAMDLVKDLVDLKLTARIAAGETEEGDLRPWTEEEMEEARNILEVIRLLKEEAKSVLEVDGGMRDAIEFAESLGEVWKGEDNPYAQLYTQEVA